MSLILSRSIRPLLALVLVTFVAAPALAGPPLVCFPFDIGPATSLPWDQKKGEFRGMRTDYDVSHLTSDTVALLTPTTPIVVRMETLRRAALYATTNDAVAHGLVDALVSRAKKSAGRSGAAEAALAEFDAGYLIETMKQTRGIANSTASIVEGLDGYGMVQHSLSLRNNDPAIAFAAALMTWDNPNHAAHVRRAKEGVAADMLLAKNIDHVSH
jgi:hypothetical protein